MGCFQRLFRYLHEGRRGERSISRGFCANERMVYSIESTDNERLCGGERKVERSPFSPSMGAGEGRGAWRDVDLRRVDFDGGGPWALHLGGTPYERESLVSTQYSVVQGPAETPRELSHLHYKRDREKEGARNFVAGWTDWGQTLAWPAWDDMDAKEGEKEMAGRARLVRHQAREGKEAQMSDVCRWEEARKKRMTAPGGSQGPLLDDPGAGLRQRRTSGHRTARRTALDSCMGARDEAAFIFRLPSRGVKRQTHRRNDPTYAGNMSGSPVVVEVSAEQRCKSEVPRQGRYCVEKSLSDTYRSTLRRRLLPYHLSARAVAIASPALFGQLTPVGPTPAIPLLICSVANPRIPVKISHCPGCEGPCDKVPHLADQINERCDSGYAVIAHYSYAVRIHSYVLAEEKKKLQRARTEASSMTIYYGSVPDQLLDLRTRTSREIDCFLIIDPARAALSPSFLVTSTDHKTVEMACCLLPLSRPRTTLHAFFFYVHQLAIRPWAIHPSVCTAESSLLRLTQTDRQLAQARICTAYLLLRSTHVSYFRPCRHGDATDRCINLPDSVSKYSHFSRSSSANTVKSRPAAPNQTGGSVCLTVLIRCETNQPTSMEAF
ncbi:hypothetical protein CCUS01_17191 [Colletotrichum cuscutae]|uniref:Uncharacterized protein n=1 Tax=Colletotrichum cuscutae TaxID=1209917 RepID=A0AAI9Y251_9PEZI|nr:hypothetical protein CCUS01_17191 [Colletotrichum cuscutae]